MNFLRPVQFRHMLNISRSTEQRMLKAGLPCIGTGKLRRYEQTAAVEWFRNYAHQPHTSTTLLPPGDYECQECGFLGAIQQHMVPGPCRECGSQDIPIRIHAPVATDDNSRPYRYTT